MRVLSEVEKLKSTFSTVEHVYMLQLYWKHGGDLGKLTPNTYLRIMKVFMKRFPGREPPTRQSLVRLNHRFQKRGDFNSTCSKENSKSKNKTKSLTEVEKLNNRFTIIERVYLLQLYWRHGGLAVKQTILEKEFIKRFPGRSPPTRQSIVKLNNKFQKTGSVLDVGKPGRPKSVKKELVQLIDDFELPGNPEENVNTSRNRKQISVNGKKITRQTPAKKASDITNSKTLALSKYRKSPITKRKDCKKKKNVDRNKKKNVDRNKKKTVDPKLKKNVSKKKKSVVAKKKKT